MNDIWPAFPIVIWASSNDAREWELERLPNIITALQLNDRVSEISFCGVPDDILERFTGAMDEPFPLLTSLEISSLQLEGSLLVLPDYFLGGSAPRLRSLHLDYGDMAFSALQTLLSSTSDLEKLSLRLGYISPDAMVSCLSATTRLKTLHLDFGFTPSHGVQEGPTRIVLPDLTHFSWNGSSGYLDNLLALIDAPQLYSMKMTFDSLFLREAPQVALFLGRTERFKEPHRANITILRRSTELLFPLRTQTVHYPSLKLVFKYIRPLWPILDLVQTCHSYFLPLSTVERLDIDGVHCQPSTENTEWLGVFGFFVAVKGSMCIQGSWVASRAALQGLSVERATEVLPALRNVFIEGLEHRGLYRKALSSSSLRDNSPVTLWLSALGQHPTDRKSHSC
ncbi:hypothetical protein BC826DRAFT_354760 [Russula brevipes]|nr:hypothetical protein BC826DRAFT_354760 [Russula brevipes]